MNGKTVDAIDKVGLEAYLRGVVASEMPHDWAPEALKAQAVVARSYALACATRARLRRLRRHAQPGLRRDPDESPESDAAIAATPRQIVTYKGKVATTYFFSTSGGRTASIQDVWDSPAVPYLDPSRTRTTRSRPTTTGAPWSSPRRPSRRSSR